MMQKQPLLSINKSDFDKTASGLVVEKYTLKNGSGMAVDIITYGGSITSLRVPDRAGKIENVVLGFDRLADYEKDAAYFGAIIGRCCSRIAKGRFRLNNKQYKLAINSPPNHLHGGLKGFDKVVWTAKTEQTNNTVSLILSYLSKDMEEGYPGNLTTQVSYTLTNNNSLRVSYLASTDKKTIINLTQHSYFNLSGNFLKPILDEELTIYADTFLPIDSTSIPTGQLKSVSNTPFDFRIAKAIGRDINTENEQLLSPKGYDHCWVLANQSKKTQLAASAYEKTSGRFLEVFTNQPGLQLYTGNYLDGTLATSQGGTFGARSGYCFETQHYPNAINQPQFPSVVLDVGELYQSETQFRFGIQ